MTQYRDTALAVPVRFCPSGQIQFGLIWSAKARLCGECTHTFTGGGIEEGESAEEAVRRELVQEVHLSPAQYKLYLIAHGTSDFIGPAMADGRVKRYRFFLAICNQGVELQSSEEAATASWFAPQQVLAIAEQSLSSNKRNMIARLTNLLLAQYPDVFRRSERVLRQLSGELALAA